MHIKWFSSESSYRRRRRWRRRRRRRRRQRRTPHSTITMVTYRQKVHCKVNQALVNRKWSSPVPN